MGTTVNGDVFQVSRGETDCLRLRSTFCFHWALLGLTVCCVDCFLVMLEREPLETGTDELLGLSSGVSSFRKEWHGMKEI